MKVTAELGEGRSVRRVRRTVDAWRAAHSGSVRARFDGFPSLRDVVLRGGWDRVGRTTLVAFLRSGFPRRPRGTPAHFPNMGAG